MSKVIAAVVVVALLAAGVWWYFGRGSATHTATAQRGSIDVTIQTVGTLQAAAAVPVLASETGSVVQLGARAGDVVQQGDILALLDPAPYQQALDAAQANETTAEFALQAAEQQASATPTDTQARLATLNAGQAVDNAQQAVRDAQRALAQTAIVAPADGTLLQLSIQVGGAVSAQQPIGSIAAPGAFELAANVDELDLPNVQLGATARFRLDAYPATEVTGVVTATAPQATQQGGATVFVTTIAFTPPSGLDLRPGMNADVTIVTAERQDVLLIPQSALKTVGERVFVTVLANGKREQREITLGYRGNDQVEVVSGLSDGDKVVVP